MLLWVRKFGRAKIQVASKWTSKKFGSTIYFAVEVTLMFIDSMRNHAYQCAQC